MSTFLRIVGNERLVETSDDSLVSPTFNLIGSWTQPSADHRQEFRANPTPSLKFATLDVRPLFRRQSTTHSTMFRPLARTLAQPTLRTTLTPTNQSATLLRRFYHEKVLDHYNRPRNVGSLPKTDIDVGTGLYLPSPVHYFDMFGRDLTCVVLVLRHVAM